MHQIFYVAGLVFTEWYWAPILFLVLTFVTIAASTSIVYAVFFIKMAWTGKARTLTKQAKDVVLFTACLSLIASILLYGGVLR
jgi:hypothetical protein